MHTDTENCVQEDAAVAQDFEELHCKHQQHLKAAEIGYDPEQFAWNTVSYLKFWQPCSGLARAPRVPRLCLG